MAQRKTASKAGGKGRTSKRSTKKASSGRSASAAHDEAVTLDRRRSAERRGEQAESPEPAQKLERRKKVNRRRQIDPTTCERDYTDEEVEFMNALDDYKRRSGRMFPTCSEVLEVVRGLGYVKMPAAELESLRTACAAEAPARPMASDWAAAGAGQSASTDDIEPLVDDPQMAY